MKLRLLTLVVVTFVMVSCGGSKKTTSRHSDRPHPNIEAEIGRHIPSIEELPNPLEIETPNFKSDVHKYIYQYKDVAMEEMVTFGIPASITLAQGILESGAGDSPLTRKSNNHFGIKCHGWKGARVYHDDDRNDECFRKYKNPLYSFRDHSLFLTSRSRYNKLFELDPDNYRGWARGLKAAGYATDPKYPDKLIGLIRRYQLYKYDQKVLRKYKSIGARSNNEINHIKLSNRHPSAAPVASGGEERYYIVHDGDTLYSISKKFGLSVEELKAQNKLSGNIIKVGQKLDVSSL